jgi:hypothetical protein
MRITHLNITRHILGLLILFIFSITFFLPLSIAQNEPILSIEVLNTDEGVDIDNDTVFEGKSYTIIINIEDEYDPIFAATEVNVSVLGKNYTTSNETHVITIQAPRFEDTTLFKITASKQGYTSVERQLSVIKGQLQLTVKTTIEEKKEFQVNVTNQDNAPIQNAYVYLTPESPPIATNALGIAYLSAPEVDQNTNYDLVVKKNGYLDATGRIRVQQEASVLDFFNTQFLQIIPIIFGIIIVVGAILYVGFRKQRTQMPPVIREEPLKPSGPEKPGQKEKPAQRIENQATLYSVHNKKNSPVLPSNSRVEEIRIPAQEKKKETAILTEEKIKEPPVVDKKLEGDEWFKGQDYMRYKLDELTGKIDGKTDGKWFEGQHDSKYKVDEALKKSTKKKKTDEDDNK